MTGHDETDPTTLRLVRSNQLSSGTAQTAGMRRSEAISGVSCGSRDLWMGETRLAPGARSANHHHGHSETGIYVIAGRPVFVVVDGASGERRLETSPTGTARSGWRPSRATTSSYLRTCRTAKRTRPQMRKRSSSSPARHKRRSSSTLTTLVRSLLPTHPTRDDSTDLSEAGQEVFIAAWRDEQALRLRQDLAIQLAGSADGPFPAVDAFHRRP